MNTLQPPLQLGMVMMLGGGVSWVPSSTPRVPGDSSSIFIHQCDVRAPSWVLIQEIHFGGRDVGGGRDVAQLVLPQHEWALRK